MIQLELVAAEAEFDLRWLGADHQSERLQPSIDHPADSGLYVFILGQDIAFKQLEVLLGPVGICYHTDDWEAFERNFKLDKYQLG